MSGRNYPTLMPDLITTQLLHGLHKEHVKAAAVAAQAWHTAREAVLLEDIAARAYYLELDLEQRRQGFGVDLGGTLRKLSDADRKEIAREYEK